MRHDEGVSPWQIAVLSGVSATQSAVWKQRTFGNEYLVNEALEDDGRSKGLASDQLPEEPGEVLFESIRRFKGLEREVIILVELPESGERLDELLYVGMTRATTELVVITPPALAKRFRQRNCPSGKDSCRRTRPSWTDSPSRRLSLATHT